MTRAALATALLIAGCTAPKIYMGVDLVRAAADPAERRVQELARAAHAGSKSAQLELGQLFEDGRGVPEDFDRACRLYAMAGATTGGTIYVYSPPVTKGGAGRVVPIDRPVEPGMSAARERLRGLRYRLSASERLGSACLGGSD